jgi:hypothetical protein
VQAPQGKHKGLLDAALKSTSDLLTGVEQHVVKQKAALAELDRLRDAKAADVGHSITKLHELRTRQNQQHAMLRSLGAAASIQLQVRSNSSLTRG